MLQDLSVAIVAAAVIRDGGLVLLMITHLRKLLWWRINKKITIVGAAGQYQVIMKQVELDLVAPDACQSALRQTELGRFFRLHDSFVCAGGDAGVDTCKGDGGGPLVCPVRDPATGDISNYVQVGIVAGGVKCGTEGVPGLYASLEGEGTCFLELASRCLVGDELWGGFSGSGVSPRCNRWLRKTMKALREKRDQLT